MRAAVGGDGGGIDRGGTSVVGEGVWVEGMSAEREREREREIGRGREGGRERRRAEGMRERESGREGGGTGNGDLVSALPTSTPHNNVYTRV